MLEGKSLQTLSAGEPTQDALKKVLFKGFLEGRCEGEKNLRLRSSGLGRGLWQLESRNKSPKHVTGLQACSQK